jgi:hypothetical protein
MYFNHTIRIALFFLPVLNLYAGCTGKEKEDPPITTCYMTQISVLPAELNENSGMIWYDGLIWTINDSGSEPFIYVVDTTGQIIRIIRLAGAENTDWEEIAQDDSFVYIGDVGNNEGKRTDLRIYKISKNDLTDTVVAPEVIQYAYADQTDFTPEAYNTPYDCEALISNGDSLFLFTKNWTGNYTRIYGLPAVKGTYQAFPGGHMKVDGQLTASFYSARDHRLYLLGYNDYIPFLWICEDFYPGQSYDGFRQHYIFPEKIGTQTEGIAITDKGDILVSCEKSLSSPALYKVVLETSK